MCLIYADIALLINMFTVGSYALTVMLINYTKFKFVKGKGTTVRS